jgi:tetratricopeptide (TPR) repeat protein
MGLAELLVHTQRAHGAEEYCRKAVRLQEQLSRDSPDDLDYREELAGGYVNWANALAQTNQMQEAEQAYLKGIAQFERLTADFPGIPVFRLHLLSTYHNLALFYPGRGEFRKAEQASRQALEGFLKLAAEFPSNGTFQKLLANIQYSRALLLATCPDRGLRSAAAEVALAEKAIEHNPSDARLWLALGITHYGAGAWPEARAALEKTMQLRRGGNSQDWFWLAMIHWQLGHKDEARQWFDKAVRWMDKNNPNHNELRRLRAEAAALLQIDDRPKDQPEQKPP